MPRLIIIAVSLLLSAHAFARSIPDDLPAAGTTSTVIYDCHQVADDAIQIDGEIKDTAWSKAAPMDDFKTAYANPRSATNTSTARLLWSDKRLFLSFECRTSEIFSTMTKRDDMIWNEECAELYLCPRGPKARYYELDWSPKNVIYDSLLLTYLYEEQVKHYMEWALAYNAKIESTTKEVRDADGKLTGWILEAAIPFADLAEADNVPPKPGDRWLFNVCRIEKLNEKSSELSAWQPTMADFHLPWKFPQLKFVE